VRFTLALAALAFLFSASARADLVQLELTGQVSSITGPANSYWSYAGISVGQTIAAFLRYDTPFPGDGTGHPTGPGGPGLTLVVNGQQYGPAGTVSAMFHTYGPPPPIRPPETPGPILGSATGSMPTWG
jgi:hypothetical protein